MQAGTPLSAPWYKQALVLLAGLALLKILIHLPVLARYGYSFDELYFIACGNHLSVGYVDHAPLVPWIARLSTSLFGESLFAMRIFATVSTALTVFMTGLLALRLGGGRFAQFAAEVELEHVNPWQTPFRVLIGRSPIKPLPEIWRRNCPW